MSTRRVTYQILFPLVGSSVVLPKAGLLSAARLKPWSCKRIVLSWEIGSFPLFRKEGGFTEFNWVLDVQPGTRHEICAFSTSKVVVFPVPAVEMTVRNIAVQTCRTSFKFSPIKHPLKIWLYTFEILLFHSVFQLFTIFPLMPQKGLFARESIRSGRRGADWSSWERGATDEELFVDRCCCRLKRRGA